jgi:hypothetical protein
VKLEYQVTRPIFVRFVGQYDGLKADALRDDSRTDDPILIRTASGAFWPTILEHTADGFFVKASYVFRMQRQHQEGVGRKFIRPPFGAPT